MTRVGVWFSLLLLVCGSACSASEPPRAQRTSLSAGVVARVDGEPIYAETVVAIASAQGDTAERALEKATFDALVAREASARGLGEQAHFEVSARLARALIEELASEARAKGPPTDDELGPYIEGRWWALDRPDAVVVMHAVVLAPKVAAVDAATDAKALALARKIREAVEPVQAAVRAVAPPDFSVVPNVAFKRDPELERFQELAQSVDKGDLQVVVEHPGPVASHNYVVDTSNITMLDTPFVKAAFSLEKRGDLSEPVRSDAGYHVILLLGRLPGYTAPRAETVALFEKAILDDRVRAALERLVAQGRKQGGVSIERSADELISQVKVGR